MQEDPVLPTALVFDNGQHPIRPATTKRRRSKPSPQKAPVGPRSDDGNATDAQDAAADTPVKSTATGESDSKQNDGTLCSSPTWSEFVDKTRETFDKLLAKQNCEQVQVGHVLSTPSPDAAGNPPPPFGGGGNGNGNGIGNGNGNGSLWKEEAWEKDDKKVKAPQHLLTGTAKGGDEASAHALAGRAPPPMKPSLGLHTTRNEMRAPDLLRRGKSARGSSERTERGEDSSGVAEGEGENEKVAEEEWVWTNGEPQESDLIEEVAPDNREKSTGGAGKPVEEGVLVVPGDGGEAREKEIARVLQGVSALAVTRETDELDEGAKKSVPGAKAKEASGLTGAHGSSKNGFSAVRDGSKLTSKMKCNDMGKSSREAESAADETAGKDAISVGAAEGVRAKSAAQSETVEQTPARAKPSKGSKGSGQSRGIAKHSGAVMGGIANERFGDGLTMLGPAEGNSSPGWIEFNAGVKVARSSFPPTEEGPQESCSRGTFPRRDARGGPRADCSCRDCGSRWKEVCAGEAHCVGGRDGGKIKPGADQKSSGRGTGGRSRKNRRHGQIYRGRGVGHGSEICGGEGVCGGGECDRESKGGGGQEDGRKRGVG
ncbi:hypothetical protein KFL_002390055 [Klebsormidium nitens]|uniref:Uncharacterized protein n=1 Tax=Klebsormidium nitens TaxID=105231 RepID=A0A1Y1I4T9_KLENI|nr:hypothetical protein KFL_002390055 [Klebsormidium nitens]|eukprot:GAQ85513.1 hypothetical protein KFL_002390055 [Klebsormidium nitens]